MKILFVFLLLCFYCTVASSQDKTYKYVLKTRNFRLYEKFLKEYDDSKPCHLKTKLESNEGYNNPYEIEYFGSFSDQPKLTKMGFQIYSMIASRPFGNVAPPGGYTKPAELYRNFTLLAGKAPKIADFFDATEKYKTPETWNKKHIYCLKISENVNVDNDKPNVLIVSNHHSRELITPEIALRSANELINGYLNGNSEIINIIKENQIYIIYSINPDGLDHTWEKDNYWRKNRRSNQGGSYGVDLNRNHEIGWDFSCSGSKTPSSETYRGPSPTSEPETITMVALHKDRKFAKVLDFHSYGEEIRLEYGVCGKIDPKFSAMFKRYGNILAKKMNYEIAPSCCMAGNIAQSFYSQHSLSMLIESGKSFQPPATEMRKDVDKCWIGVLEFLKIPIRLQGHVLEENSRKPIKAKIEIMNIQMFYNETILSDEKRYGRYHLWLPDENQWNVKITADGYQSKIITIPPSTSNLDIYLTPQ
jgi:hypothetical protein